jgi:hypothetical protein
MSIEDEAHVSKAGAVDSRRGHARQGGDADWDPRHANDHVLAGAVVFECAINAEY